MLLACLGIMGTALPSADSAAPTELDQFVNFIPEGWTTNDLLRALSTDGRNVTSIQQRWEFKQIDIGLLLNHISCMVTMVTQ